MNVKVFTGKMDEQGLALLDLEVINWITGENLNKGPLSKVRIMTTFVIQFPYDNTVMYRILYE